MKKINLNLSPSMISYIVLIISSSFFIYKTANLKKASFIFPILILFIIIIMSLFSIINEIIKNKKKYSYTEFKIMFKPVFFSLIFMYTYILLMEFIGFYSTTIISIPTIGYSFGYRNKKRLIIGSLIFTTLLFFLFNVFMGREMPQGFLI